MPDTDPKAWLFNEPGDPDDLPRHVWIDRIIATRKRCLWVWDMAKKAPIGAAIVIVLWQIAQLIAGGFPQP